MKTRLILVHGLGGSARSTWAQFRKVVSEDVDVTCDILTFEYPTRKISFATPGAAINDLAGGLRTFVETRCQADDEILLVGHSLGGLVIRKYLLNEMHAGRPLRARKILLFATPNQGSGLADAVCVASFRNRHLRQLGKDSDFLDDLNDQWAASRIDKNILVWLVWSTEDRIVSRESAKSIFRGERVRTVHGKTHRSIVRPDSQDDEVYLLFKQWLELQRSAASIAPDGVHTYDEWLARQHADEFSFCPDEDRRSAIAQLQGLLSEPCNVARIVGLSGLGKTRLALEIFRFELEDRTLADHCLYIDAAISAVDIHAFVTRLIRGRERRVVVVDNCDLRKHELLAAEVRRHDSNLSLLTIDYNLEQASTHTFFLRVRPISESHIRAMLAPVYGDRIPDLERIVEFAQGFPRMAVLLAEARMDQDPNLGRLNDDVLAEKLLWGNQRADREQEGILSACALFDHFGITGDRTIHGEFIAQELAKVDFENLYSCVQRFADRGIIDRRGDFARVVPRPLAIRLAGQWWKNTPFDRQVEIIQSDMPENLAQSFCDQISRLDFLPEVKELTERLCGPQAPFGQAEVILSVRGSLLFRSLVEVNPKPTSDALYRVLNAMTISDIRSNVVDKVRRNLVWALEKACFHADAFEEAAWCMALLAAAENESWGNNATGQFVQLFRVFLSGTEAPPDLRFRVIDRLIGSNLEGAALLAIQALGEAASPRGGSRTVGAEYQGTAPPLQEWRPAIWGDAFAVWDGALARLASLVKDPACAEAAKSQIASNLRPLMGAGRHEMLEKAILEVVQNQGPLWPEAVQAIRDVFEYDSDRIPAEGVAALRKWLDLLKPTKLRDRVILAVSKAPYDHRSAGDKEGEARDWEELTLLAKDIRASEGDLPDLAPYFVTGEQRKGFYFGKELVRVFGDVEPVFSATADALRRSDDPNPAVILGLLNGLWELKPDGWKSLVCELANDPFMVRYFFDAATTGQIDQQLLERGLEVIKSGRLEARAAARLTFGKVLDSLAPNIVSNFCNQLADLSNAGAWVSLEILSMYCFGDDAKFAACQTAFKNLVLTVEFDGERTARTELQSHHWKEAAENLLALDTEGTAHDLTKKVVDIHRKKPSYGDLYHYLRPILVRLLEEHGCVTWPLVRSAVESSDLQQRWRLSMFLGGAGNLHEGPRLIDLVPLGDLMDWCETSPDVAPKFLASTITVWRESEEGDWMLTTRAIRLLEAYGEDEEVVSLLSGNVDTRSWSGSLVPHLDKELMALDKLAQSAKRGVLEWVGQRRSYLVGLRNHENKRNEESEWGIY